LLKHPTLDQLHTLGLYGMAKAFTDLAAAGQAKDLAHADWLALLLDRETSWRRDKRLTARLRAAKLRQQASVEDVDYRAARGLDRALFQKLSEGEWIDAHDNLALVGPSGVGKSWLACAIGQKACRDNRSVLYHRWPKLCEDMALARGDGRHPRLIKSLGRADLLILDDFGLEPLDTAGLLSALLGIGSGVLKIPAMDAALRLPIKVSSATSNFMIGATAAASAGAYFMRGAIAPRSRVRSLWVRSSARFWAPASWRSSRPASFASPSSLFCFCWRSRWRSPPSAFIEGFER
jgi:hypothetical protein